MLKSIQLVFFLLLLTGNAGASSLGDFHEYRDAITEHVLSNGMHFIILRDHTAPVVSFHVHVKTGSVDEIYGETGISHVIEHLAFNGTKIVGTSNWPEEKKLLDRLDRLHEEILYLRSTVENSDSISSPPSAAAICIGGALPEERIARLEKEFQELQARAAVYGEPSEFGKILDMHGAVGPNAYCSYDMTAYWVELPSNKLQLWAFLESDRLFNPVFRGFYEELQVIKEERRMRVDNSPWGKLMEEFKGIAYRVHPYKNPIIGYMRDIENMTRAKVKRFYRQHYVPSNMVVVIAGDINPEVAIPVIEKYFGGIPAGKHDAHEIPDEPPVVSERTVRVTMPAEPLMITGFNIPGARHPDTAALQVAAEILGGGRTSRLHRRLVTHDRIALSTGSWTWTPRYPGIFYLWAAAARGHTNEQLQEAILHELENFISGGISEMDLQGAVARLRMSFLTGLKSRRGLARELAWYQAVTGDWQNMFAYIDDIESVTEEDIKTVAQKYLDGGKKITGFLERQ